MLLLILVPNAPLIRSPIVKALKTVVVSIIPQNITVRVGQPFTLNVTYGDLTSSYVGDEVTGCQFTITWNASILQAASMKEIALHAATPESDWGNIWCLKHVVSNGFVNYAYCWLDNIRAKNNSYAPLKGNGTWASITFVSKISGTTDLSFSNLELATCCGVNQIGVGGNVTVINIVAGDINQDKIVDFFDAGVLSSAFGCGPDDIRWNSVADINGDNIVDIYDAIILSANYGRKTS